MRTASASASRSLLGAHRDLAGPDEQLQRDIDLLAGGVSGQRAAPKRLGDRERGVVRQAGDRQVLQQLGNQIAPFQPPEGSNRARRRRHVPGARQLEEDPQILDLFGAKRVNRWCVQILGQHEARVLGCEDRLLRRGGRQLRGLRCR